MSVLPFSKVVTRYGKYYSELSADTSAWIGTDRLPQYCYLAKQICHLGGLGKESITPTGAIMIAFSCWMCCQIWEEKKKEEGRYSKVSYVTYFGQCSSMICNTAMLMNPNIEGTVAVPQPTPPLMLRQTTA